MFRHEIPYASSGQVIGLLGGSFDPAHAGHVHITLEALKRFGLDQVWWLVSPGNPLKSRGPAPLAQRVERARSLMDHPRVQITDIEARIGTRYTAQTLRALQQHYPAQRFVWLMGADNLAQFHLWQDWQGIAESVPLGILARPGQRISARMSRTAKFYADYRIAGRNSQLLSHARAPAWCFVNVPMINVSSSAIRASGGWSAQAR
ncbi:nicotinate-nucleotide adenylyltransferase [Sulfitobacter sp. F26169L]|uniref:nicotinate-nucleotide adenylyltransferase n=1 Tax=Sulfitobacter sp. F26169L TaxID=2996015 RepID=UPI002260FA99|nr:nicotinate-nucleotide adenylyltransferase [Sulfitobacter sp. F26169L]MCX7567843.1 nicotinate-nucleotide adenylyltransferase [Sulfitobacter sp. F26169L]